MHFICKALSSDKSNSSRATSLRATHTHTHTHLRHSGLKVITSAKEECLKSLFEILSSLWCPQTVKECIPQTRGGRGKGPILHGAGFSPERMEMV